MSKNNKIKFEAVRKQCLLPKDVTLTPEMVWKNASRIHDFMVEIRSKNSVGARIILFGWASQELDIDIKQFQQKFEEGIATSTAYQEMNKKKVRQDLIYIAITIVILIVLALAWFS